MEIPASARGADSSWTLAPDLSNKRVSRFISGDPNALTEAV